jgi:hypothetical protein
MLALVGSDACGIDMWRCGAGHCEPEVVGPIYVGDIHHGCRFGNITSIPSSV